MDLSTLARVKVATGNTGGTTEDALLQQLLSAVSVTMEQAMGLWAQQTERTEVYPIPANARLLTLKGNPINLAVAFEVTVSPTRDFTTGGGGTVYVVNEDFVVNDVAGYIQLITLPVTRVAGAQGFPILPANVRVKYTGGLATNAAGIITAYPDIADACDLQVAYRYKRKDNPGTMKATLGGTEAAFDKQYGLLDEVARVCRYYRKQVTT